MGDMGDIAGGHDIWVAGGSVKLYAELVSQASIRVHYMHDVLAWYNRLSIAL